MQPCYGMRGLHIVLDSPNASSAAAFAPMHCKVTMHTRASKGAKNKQQHRAKAKATLAARHKARAPGKPLTLFTPPPITIVSMCGSGDVFGVVLRVPDGAVGAVEHVHWRVLGDLGGGVANALVAVCHCCSAHDAVSAHWASGGDKRRQHNKYVSAVARALRRAAQPRKDGGRATSTTCRPLDRIGTEIKLKRTDPVGAWQRRL